MSTATALRLLHLNSIKKNVFSDMRVPGPAACCHSRSQNELPGRSSLGTDYKEGPPSYDLGYKLGLKDKAWLDEFILIGLLRILM